MTSFLGGHSGLISNQGEYAVIMHKTFVYDLEKRLLVMHDPLSKAATSH